MVSESKKKREAAKKAKASQKLGSAAGAAGEPLADSTNGHAAAARADAASEAPADAGDGPDTSERTVTGVLTSATHESLRPGRALNIRCLWRCLSTYAEALRNIELLHLLSEAPHVLQAIRWGAIYTMTTSHCCFTGMSCLRTPAWSSTLGGAHDKAVYTGYLAAKIRLFAKYQPAVATK